MAVEAGQELLHYRLIEKIGAGGMGVVWKAEDRKLLNLASSSETDGLPQASGEPECTVATEGSWHVHNGGWSPDSKSIVYTRDQDYGDLYELVAR
jgi:hypothetical protein